MKRTTTIVLAMACCGAIATATLAQTHAHWSYDGEVGPAQWSKLDAAYATCGNGRSQSPVALGGFISAELPPIAFDYRAGDEKITNNGHSVQVDVAPGSRITVDGIDFALKQFHFHAPSEHTIDGRSFPMEVHFVHADAQGDLAVVSVMVEDGAENAAIAAIDAAAPRQAGQSGALSPVVAPAALLPEDRDYYRYDGSLTTPPCTEGVRWFVMKDPIRATSAQIAQVSTAIGFANNRPVAPAGARVFLE